MTKIYLSSTYSDLAVYREAVYIFLRRIGYDVIAIEDYVATDTRPIDKSLADITASDIYLGIFAWKYGYISPENNPEHISITELEYRKAKQLNKPTLIFMLDEDAPWPVKWIDAINGDGEKRILRFREYLAQTNVVAYFRNPEELASIVAQAIHNWEDAKTTNLVNPYPGNRIPSHPVNVFYSYAHEDEKLKIRLEKHLSMLRWQGLITEWHDRKIVAGREWAQEINNHINTADIILLLISPDFLASNYCYGIETKIALKRHSINDCQTIPIILRPSDWENTPLASLQALPLDGRAVTKWSNRDEAFLDIIKGIRKAIIELTSKEK